MGVKEGRTPWNLAALKLLESFHPQNNAIKYVVETDNHYVEHILLKPPDILGNPWEGGLSE